jgi:hypothetical protein
MKFHGPLFFWRIYLNHEGKGHKVFRSIFYFCLFTFAFKNFVSSR